MTMGSDKKFVPPANGIPFGRNVHAAILSSIPEIIGSYMRYRTISLQSRNGDRVPHQVRSL